MKEKSGILNASGDMHGDGAAQVARLVAVKGGASPKAQAAPQRAESGLQSVSSSVRRRKKFVIGRLDFRRGILKTIELGTASSLFLRPPILALKLVSFSKARAPKMRSMDVPR